MDKLERLAGKMLAIIENEERGRHDDEAMRMAALFAACAGMHCKDDPFRPEHLSLFIDLEKCFDMARDPETAPAAERVLSWIFRDDAEKERIRAEYEGRKAAGKEDLPASGYVSGAAFERFIKLRMIACGICIVPLAEAVARERVSSDLSSVQPVLNTAFVRRFMDEIRQARRGGATWGAIMDSLAARTGVNKDKARLSCLFRRLAGGF